MVPVLHRVRLAGTSARCDVASFAVSQTVNREAAERMPTDPARSIVTLERELAFLAEVRGMIRQSVGSEDRIPTSAVDSVLDELIVARSQEP